VKLDFTPQHNKDSLGRGTKKVKSDFSHIFLVIKFGRFFTSINPKQRLELIEESKFRTKNCETSPIK
jgi:hypothetical protein